MGTRARRNLRGNEIVDIVVKLTSRRCEKYIPVHYKDWDNIIANKMRDDGGIPTVS